MDTTVIKLLSDTLKFFGALLLTLALCCLSMYATPEAASSVVHADSALQHNAVPVATSSSYEEIQAKMLNADNAYRTVSFDFYECDLRTTPEPIITMAQLFLQSLFTPQARTFLPNSFLKKVHVNGNDYSPEGQPASSLQTKPRYFVVEGYS